MSHDADDERPTKRRRIDVPTLLFPFPDDMVTEIASRVFSVADVEAMALTCKDWHRALCDKAGKKRIWKSLTDRDFPGAPTYMHGLRLLANRMEKISQKIAPGTMGKSKGKVHLESKRNWHLSEVYQMPDAASWLDEYIFRFLSAVDPQATMRAYEYTNPERTMASGYELSWKTIHYSKTWLSFWSGWESPSSWDSGSDSDSDSDSDSE
jgi:hypothetical protein